jgi:phenylpropionate dioxygenase-like ring-hydroxylating dioxygenase large terminal subunit
MRVTILMNRFGHLEIWLGDRTDAESDLYVQVDHRVDDVLDCLNKEEAFDVKAGWDLTTEVSDELMGGLIRDQIR